jgi:hypothetical protein
LILTIRSPLFGHSRCAKLTLTWMNCLFLLICDSKANSPRTYLWLLLEGYCIWNKNPKGFKLIWIMQANYKQIYLQCLFFFQKKWNSILFWFETKHIPKTCCKLKIQIKWDQRRYFNFEIKRCFSSWLWLIIALQSKLISFACSCACLQSVLQFNFTFICSSTL